MKNVSLRNKLFGLLAAVSLVAAPVLIFATADSASADTPVSTASGLKDAFHDTSVSVINVTASINLADLPHCDDLTRHGSAGVTVNGVGTGITISQAPDCLKRIFKYDGSGTLTINNLTLTGGTACGAGGAVKSEGPVNVTGSAITGNRALYRWECDELQVNSATEDVSSEHFYDSPYGGGVFSYTDVTVSNSTISNNHADDTGGGIASNGTVTVSGSTFNQDTAGESIDEVSNTAFLAENHHCLCSGGAIAAAAEAQTHVTDSTITNSGATCGEKDHCGALGGGIYVGGSIVLAGSTVTGNDAGAWPAGSYPNAPAPCQGCGAKGGGVFAPGGAEVSTSTISSNTAGNCTDGCAAEGGGLYTGSSNGREGSVATGVAAFDHTSVAGPVTIDQSTFDSNVATCPTDAGCNGSGGGGYFYNPASVDITASTFSNNTALRYGGAFATDVGGVSCDSPECIQQYDVTMTNSTVTGNTGSESGAVDAYGSHLLKLVHDTIDANNLVAPPSELAAATQVRAATELAIPANVSSDSEYEGTFESSRTTITAPSGGPNCAIYYPPTTSDGYNYSDDTSCGFTASTDSQSGSNDPMLGALADNTGPTMTQLPGNTSPLIDAIPVANCDSSVPTDQRGVTRPQAQGCDIGAVEVKAASLQVTKTTSGFSPAFPNAAAAGYSGSYTFAVTCTYGSTTPITKTLTVTSSDGGDSDVLSNLRQGSTCTVVETPVTVPNVVASVKTTYDPVGADSPGVPLTQAEGTAYKVGVDNDFTDVVAVLGLRAVAALAPKFTG